MPRHIVDVVYGASEGYPLSQAKFMDRPKHITGTTVMVDVCSDDFAQISTAGPFIWTDAVMYAEHAQGLETFEDAVKFLLDVSRADDAVNYQGRTPRNDWTGLLAPLQPA